MLPHLAALRLDCIWLKGVRVRIEATTTAEQVSCPVVPAHRDGCIAGTCVTWSTPESAVGR